MLITLNSLVDNCSSNSQGVKLFNALDSAVHKNNEIIIVVDNNCSLSSSFLNSSIGSFLEKYGIDLFKSKVKFKGSKNQFNRISEYLNKFSNLYSC
ncbi:STAS-like domain-containing protein [Gillisia sp. Hel_I_29]|uniref:STAS-like domain-containing protein n=1 Tax=Gillisia sp. Hel_I_29 TaxID=1249975 RepID=UPI000559815D